MPTKEENVQGSEVVDEITRPTKAGKAAKTLVRGAMAACAIIDDVCQTAKEEDDSFDQAGNVTVSAMAAKTADKKGKIERKTRPSGKLKGWRRLIEICTEEDSCLGLTSEEFDNVSVIRITKEIDWSDDQTVQQTRKMIENNPGTSLHGSLPCTVWCK